MTPFVTFLLLAILTAFTTWFFRSGPKPAAAAKVRVAAPIARRQPAMPSAPRIDAIEWTERPAAIGGRDLEARLRDRYAAVRFPGVFAIGGAKESMDHVIGAARRYFEEEKIDRAQELLDLAVARSPGEAQLRLAQIEIAFLMREPALFIRLAAAFKAVHPGHAAWSEVVRLGFAIAPDEPLFASHLGIRAHDHYGPWPDMPNWIGASWDLTSEVLAADFHRAMAGHLHQQALPLPLRRVA